MPPFEDMDRQHTAVLWMKVGNDDYGRPALADPIELSPDIDETGVRWTDKKSQVTGPTGEPVSVDATVDVDREIPIGSLMWYGKLVDWMALTPNQRTNMMEVVGYSEADDIKARFTKYQVQLKFYSNTFPVQDH